MRPFQWQSRQKQIQDLWQSRRATMLADRERGLTLQEIGNRWHISRERVRQLTNRARRERNE